ncbi:MAG: aminotransferase class V-fold PLP-dependent enzyme [Planctomycetota bacterium]
MPADDAPAIYLDHAATAWPKAPGLGAAMAEAIDGPMGNPGRSPHAFAERAHAAVETARRAAAKALGLTEPWRIAFTSGCTEAANGAVFGVVHAMRRAGVGRPTVAASRGEHHAVRRAVCALEKYDLADVVWIDPCPEGRVTPDAVAKAIEGRPSGVDLVCVQHASNVTAAIHDVVGIGQVARDYGALFLVDAAQTAGLLAIHLEQLPIDLLACCGHKSWRGPAGVGLLALGKRFDRQGRWTSPKGVFTLEPWRLGGAEGSSEPTRMPPDLPARLEAGTPNLPGVVGLGYAIQNCPACADHNDAQALVHERALRTRLRRGLADLSGVTLLGPEDPAECTGVQSLVLDGWPCQDVAAALTASFGIAVRAGFHCAPGACEAVGAPDGCVRASFGPETRADEVDTLIQAVRALVGAPSVV